MNIDDTTRELLCDWLRANGVDPLDVPTEPHASVSDNQLTLLMHVRDEAGRKVIDPEGPRRILTRPITVPLRVQPTGVVARWLEPACPTCNR